MPPTDKRVDAYLRAAAPFVAFSPSHRRIAETVAQVSSGKSLNAKYGR